VAFLRSSRTLDAFDRLTAAAVDDDAATSEPAAAAPTGAALLADLDAGSILTSSSSLWRDLAMSVPAYRRARTLIAQNVAQAKLCRVTADGRMIDGSPFMRRPDPSRTSVAFWADIVGDLADYGTAFAVNTRREWAYADARDRSKRKHRAVVRIDPDRITYDPERDVYAVTGTDGAVREYAPEYVIGFECSAGGWLRDGSRAVTTARLLEDSARLYAENPTPLTTLKNTGPRKTPKQVGELLDAWIAARRARTVAYLGRDIEAEHGGTFDAQQIALAEARAMAVLDIARLTGVPALYLEQGPNDASMAYQNMTERRIDLLGACQPFATAIEQRFSWDDVTGEGTLARFDFGPWLRVDPALRASLYRDLVPLGVLTIEEARAMEDFAPTSTSSTTPPDDPEGAPA
jgi:hypothetical protein